MLNDFGDLVIGNEVEESNKILLDSLPAIVRDNFFVHLTIGFRTVQQMRTFIWEYWWTHLLKS